ncbi:MAG: 2-deoxy-5-keto-D-gluconate 6-phosphate aldolase domain-containing protein [Streptosporangiaceae bacterium]
MTLGWDKPLYLMAFGHRGSFEHGLFGASPPVPAEVHAGITNAKEIIFEAHMQALAAGAPAEACGVLVDEEFGASVARCAKAEAAPLALPVERSGQDEFDFEYGEDFGAHIEALDPTFAKVLVRYNPEGDAELNRRQTERLARLSRWLRDRNRKFLFELLVPATGGQLDRFDGHQRDYDRQLRPRLVVATIRAMQAADVAPDVWKIEGLDERHDCEAVVAQARAGGRDGVPCIGRDADEPQVIEWIKIGAAVPGFDGFAVGRTLWQQALQDFLAGKTDRQGAVDRIAGRYRDVIDAYREAEAVRADSNGESA